MTDPVGTPPPEVMTRLTLAESRLYPMALSDPEGYERAVTLVGLAAADLREHCADLDSVVARRDELIAVLPALADAHQVRLGGLPPDVLVDAASALRLRELQARA
jgi:hypothetical protein